MTVSGAGDRAHSAQSVGEGLRPGSSGAQLRTPQWGVLWLRTATHPRLQGFVSCAPSRGGPGLSRWGWGGTGQE